MHMQQQVAGQSFFTGIDLGWWIATQRGPGR